MKRMSEDQIERCVEVRMNGLDRMFMAGRYTQAEYDQKVAALNLWSERAAKIDQTTARIQLYSF